MTPLLEDIIKPVEKPLEKVLQAGGIAGLLAVMVTCFLMFVVWQGQQQMQSVHMQLLDIGNKQLLEQENQTKILTDIRYAVNAGNGIVFRNHPISPSN